MVNFNFIDTISQFLRLRNCFFWKILLSILKLTNNIFRVLTLWVSVRTHLWKRSTLPLRLKTPLAMEQFHRLLLSLKYEAVMYWTHYWTKHLQNHPISKMCLEILVTVDLCLAAIINYPTGKVVSLESWDHHTPVFLFPKTCCMLRNHIYDHFKLNQVYFSPSFFCWKSFLKAVYGRTYESNHPPTCTVSVTIR